MKTYVIWLFAAFLVLPSSAYAHTTLSSSLPAEGEVVAEPIEDIQLTFDTPIENSSTMTLSGPEGTIEFSEVAVSGDTMIGTLEEELPNGPYTVSWNIIGEDGHPIEGQVPFELEAGNTIEENAEEASGEAETEAAPAENTVEEEAADLEEGEGSRTLTVILAALLSVIIIAAYFFLKKKR